MDNRAPDTSHESLATVKPHNYSRHGSSAEHSLSPWAHTADSDDSWASNFYEPLFSELLDTFDDDFESHVFNMNREDGRIDQLEPSTSDNFEGIRYSDANDVHGHVGLPHEPTHSQTLQFGILMDTSRTPSDVQTRCLPYQAVTNMSTGPFETFGAQFTPGNRTHLERLRDGPGIPIPRVDASDAVVNTVGIRSENAIPELQTNFLSPTRQDDETQILDQVSSKVLASDQFPEYLPSNDRYRPNNYQIAMLDRRPAYMLGNGDQFRLETPIADRVSAFCADADRTVLDAAALSNTDESFASNMRRVKGSLSTFQTPIRPPPRLQHCQSSSSSASSCSFPRSSSQAPVYPTPPSSFQPTEYYQVGSPFIRDHLSSNPSRLRSVSLNSSSSPTPLSQRNAPDEARKSCRCTICPDKTYQDRCNLKRHMRDNHKGKDRLPCLKEGCDASFAPGRKDNRLKHVRAKHPDYPLPAPSRKRKRNADNDLESNLTNGPSFEPWTTG